MILVDDMLAVAFQYRDTELWKELTDSDVFAFRLSDGETGYCCVMGNAGEHLALGFYRGRKGFTTYLKTISSGNAHLSEIEMFEMTTTFDCINCDFMQASDMDVKTKKIIRNYADAHKLSRREQEVLTLVLKGNDAQNIASELVISPGTVKAHLHRIYVKSGVSNRDDLIDAFWRS